MSIEIKPDIKLYPLFLIRFNLTDSIQKMTWHSERFVKNFKGKSFLLTIWGDIKQQ